MKKKLKKGGGEILAFLFSLPILVLVFAYIVAIFQRGMLKERLEYTAYLACRKAIVAHTSENLDEDAGYMDIGGESARLAFEEAVRDLNASGLKYNDVFVNVAETNGTNGWDYALNTTYEDVEDDDNEILEDEDNIWKKGIFLRCTVEISITPPIIFMPDTISSSIVMMVEGPASGDGFKYEWFEVGDAMGAI